MDASSVTLMEDFTQKTVLTSPEVANPFLLFFIFYFACNMPCLKLESKYVDVMAKSGTSKSTHKA